MSFRFRKSKQRAWQLLAFAVALSLIVFSAPGCGAQKAAKEKPAQSERIAVYAVADPTGDWGFPSPYAHYSRGPGYVRMSFIFDTLVWKDSKGYVPALAESWEYLKNENAYVFKLRKNATWHDGQEFTAGDVVFTFDYMKEHPYEWVDLSVVEKVEAVDDCTVKAYLTKPYAPFMDNIACTVPILPEHIWKDVQNPEQFQEKEALIGTGPFRLVDYNKAQGTYLYQAYDNYYQGKPKVEQLKFVKISDEMAASALRQKQVNAASIPPELAEDLKKEGFTVIESSHDWVAKLMINHKKAPFNDKKFRQALAYAIDRRQIVAACLRGHGLAGSPGIVPSDSHWFDPETEQYPYNPAKAGEILESLGYVKKDGYYQKGGRALELVLLVSGGGSSPGEREGEMIRQQLENAGIKVNLRSLEAKTLDNMVVEWKFDLALSGHGGIGGDPEILSKVIIGQGFNSARFVENKHLVDLLKKQQQATDGKERKKIVGEIQKVYAGEVPALPIYYPTWYLAHDGQVELFYTWQGIASGVPIALNKAAFVK
ncbi:MAG: ABC transporter substrate-binding protein [Bacillota bacterium]|nr:ABC transporter substrate-binding protein [Bacillota bacterium]